MWWTPIALAATVFASPGDPSNDAVQVVVDMDATAPGVQSRVLAPPGQSIVRDIAIHVFDPTSVRPLWGIGYIGGLDRGIAFGHTPSNRNVGVVESLVPAAGAPINPANTAELLSPAHDPGFEGPEVQYLEWGAAEPSVIRAQPGPPVFTVDVVLSGARPGDVFDFFLLDRVTVWSGGMRGAFSTSQPLSLDTGGDAVPDGTVSADGVDADPGLPVPPAAYPVDYVDGGDSGPAKIIVSSAVDVAHSAAVAIRFHPIHPDPFDERAVMSFELPRQARVRLGVFDLFGRRVRLLLDGAVALGGGPHAAVWDGRDDDGVRAPAGVYFSTLEAAGLSLTRRVVRLY